MNLQSVLSCVLSRASFQRHVESDKKSNEIKITVWNCKGCNPHHNRAGRTDKRFALSTFFYGKLFS